MERRQFLQGIIMTGAAASSLSGQSTGETPEHDLPRAESAGDLKGEMLYRKLGKTGETVSAIGLAGRISRKRP
jgi:hypothetical protein